MERWCRRWRLETGEAIGLEQAWRLAQAWYAADRRDPAWRRRSAEETAALFAALGLTSPFWSIRESSQH